jgi:hypothetical protein
MPKFALGQSVTRVEDALTAARRLRVASLDLKVRAVAQIPIAQTFLSS